MKANSAASEVLQLPLLPLFQAVLLPGGFVRVLIPQSWRKSAALVQHLLSQQGEVYVAAVPYLGKAADDDMVDEHLDLEKLYHTGTAARVLQLQKRTEVRATWGCCGSGALVLFPCNIRSRFRPQRCLTLIWALGPS